MGQTENDTRAQTRSWYESISEQARAALKIVGVTWTEFDRWTGGPYFSGHNKVWTPKSTDDAESFARTILDDIASRTAGSAPGPAKG